MLIRCACGRLQEARDSCLACGTALPVVERLDGRAVALRQAAVVRLLGPAERDALAAVCEGLGLVGSWWRVEVVADLFVLLAGARAMERRMARGASRTAALREAASALGVPFTTLRDHANKLVLQKGAP